MRSLRYSRQMVWVDQETVTTPKQGMCSVLVDHWWIVNEQGQVALYEGEYPQCNTDRRIAERLRNGVAFDVVKIPVAFLPHRCEY